LAVVLGALAYGHGQAEIVVPAGETQTIPPGLQRITRLELRSGSTLVVSGTTTILVDRLITEPGATVQFIPARDVYDTDVALTINALDASGLQELRVVGNGRDGSGYEVGDRAPAGASGRDALDCGHSLRYPAGREATSGGRGGTGQAGQHGTHALDVLLYLPNVPPGGHVVIEANGGKGGRGQGGGNGGRGGNSSNCHDGRNGGPGGPGGRGGDGGDGGNVFVFLIVPDDVYSDVAKRDERIQSIRFDITNNSGSRGSGGDGGDGGNPGRGALIGPGRRTSGDPGTDGPDGADGAPARSQIEAMSQSAYLQFIAQQMRSFGD